MTTTGVCTTRQEYPSARAARQQPARNTLSPSLRTGLLEKLFQIPRDDAACLDWLWRARYSRDGRKAFCDACGVMRRFHRVKSADLNFSGIQEDLFAEKTWEVLGLTHGQLFLAGTLGGAALGLGLRPQHPSP